MKKPHQYYKHQITNLLWGTFSWLLSSLTLCMYDSLFMDGSFVFSTIEWPFAVNLVMKIYLRLYILFSDWKSKSSHFNQRERGLKVSYGRCKNCSQTGNKEISSIARNRNNKNVLMHWDLLSLTLSRIGTLV